VSDGVVVTRVVDAAAASADGVVAPRANASARHSGASA
jgi:hypothetical protein